MSEGEGKEVVTAHRKAHFIRRWAGFLAVVLVVLCILILGAYRLGGNPPEVLTHSKDEGAVLKAPPTPPSSNHQSVAKPAPEVNWTQISGHVVDPAGKGIPNAQVLASPTQTSSDGPSMVKEPGSTDQSGAFTISVTPPGAEFLIRAKATGYLEESQQITVPAEGIDNVEFVLQPAGLAAGRVVDLTGHPVSNAVVQAMTRSGENHYSESAPTSQDGLFEVQGLRAGEYGLSARLTTPGGGRWGIVGVTVGQNEPLATISLGEGEQRRGIELVVPLSSDRVVSGQVVDERGRPVPNAEVWAVAPFTDNAVVGVAGGPSDERGGFRIENILLAAGNTSDPISAIEVHCQHPDYEPTVVKPVPVGSRGLEVVLSPLRRGGIKGIVRDANTREAITGATVLLAGVRGPWGSDESDYLALASMARKGEGRVSWRGRFAYSDVRPGTATLVTFAPGYGMTQTAVEVQADQTTEVEILLEKAGLLRINVIYTGHMEGREAEDFNLVCRPVGEEGTSIAVAPEMQRGFRGEPKQPPSATAAAVYEMELAPGLYEVEVHSYINLMRGIRGASAPPASHNIRLAEAEVASGRTTDLDLEIGGTGTIEGYVSLGKDEYKAYVRLTPGTDLTPIEEGAILAERVAYYGIYQYASTWTGEYQLNCIPPGTYTVTVTGQSKDRQRTTRHGSKVVEIRADEVVILDFP